MDYLGQRIRFCTARDGVRVAYAMAGNGPPLVKAANCGAGRRGGGHSGVIAVPATHPGSYGVRIAAYGATCGGRHCGVRRYVRRAP